jgi:hypothetical protein
VDDSLRPARAEAITQILAPALARWVYEHPEQVNPTSFGGSRHVLQFTGRTSGGVAADVGHGGHRVRLMPQQEHVGNAD